MGTVAIIRNAGGSAKAALRDLIVCTQIIGGTTVVSTFSLLSSPKSASLTGEG